MSNLRWEPKTDKSEWAAFEKGFTSSVMNRVDGYRKERGLTVEALCRRLDELGWPVSVSTMNGMLGSKRQSLSFPELLVMARALQVAPAVLMLPLATNEPVDLSPAVQTDALSALSYLTGRWTLETQILDWLEGEESSEVATSLDPITNLYEHQWLTDWFEVLERRMLERKEELAKFVETGEWTDFRDGAIGDGLGSQVGFVRHSDLTRNLIALRSLRMNMANRGMRLPPLPPAVQAALEEQDRDRIALVWAKEFQGAQAS